MGGNDIRQHLLQDVVRFGGAHKVAVEHRLHAGQTTDAGALGVGDQAGMHPAHEFGGCEPGGQERIDGGDHVPQRHPVDGCGHVSANAPHLRVESSGDLTADGTRKLHLARHPDLGARLADHLPLTGVGNGAHHGALGVCMLKCPSFSLRGHDELKVAIQEDTDE